MTTAFTGITANANFSPVSAAGGPLPRNGILVGPTGSFVNITGTATISGNGFAGTATTVATPGAAIALTGAGGAQLTGELAGNFFGPTAEEAGGVIRLGDPGGAQIVGGFAGMQ